MRLTTTTIDWPDGWIIEQFVYLLEELGLAEHDEDLDIRDWGWTWTSKK